jgi:hypothetical protein
MYGEQDILKMEAADILRNVSVLPSFNSTYIPEGFVLR